MNTITKFACIFAFATGMWANLTFMYLELEPSIARFLFGFWPFIAGMWIGLVLEFVTALVAAFLSDLRFHDRPPV